MNITSTFLALAIVVLCSSRHLHAADPWKEKPILSALQLSVSTTMTEYESWVEEWRKEKRSANSTDQSINLMAETTFLTVQMALEAHPNPQLLEKCLIFLGVTVPPEFDDLWRARILEVASLDQTTTGKVDAMLKAKNLPGLEARAMGRKG